MYEAFYGLREKPFSLLPDPDFLFPSAKHCMVLSLLEYSLVNQAGFTVITGGIGTGKTTLIRHMLNTIEQDITVGLISNTHPGFGGLLPRILQAYGLDYAGKGDMQMYDLFTDFLIREYAERRRTVLIVDEAQNLPSDTLEQLRLLSNVNMEKDLVLQVILVGQVGLRKTLQQPELQQFAQRIAIDYHLKPLTAEETHDYICHRIRVADGDPELFQAEACERVYEASGGIPRIINLLCDTALVYGYGVDQHSINAVLVEDVVRDKSKGGLFVTRKLEEENQA